MVIPVLENPWLTRIRESSAKLRIWMAIPIMILSGCAADWRAGEQYGLFEPWLEVRGAQLSPASGGLNTDYIALQYPASISARGNDVVVVDTGKRSIYRYQRLQQPFNQIMSMLPVYPGMSILADSDQSVYVTSPAEGKVIHFTIDGMPLPSLSSPDSLAHPVSLAMSPNGGQIFVADGLYNHIVVFNRAGGQLGIIKLPQLKSVSVLAAGPHGIYAIDRSSRKVVVMGFNGEFRQAYDLGPTADPTCIAIEGNMMFIGDSFDRSVKAYKIHGHQVELTGLVGGAGELLDSFASIDGLAISDDMLFVSDGINGRIQTFMINRNAITPGY